MPIRSYCHILSLIGLHHEGLNFDEWTFEPVSYWQGLKPEVLTRLEIQEDEWNIYIWNNLLSATRGGARHSPGDQQGAQRGDRPLAGGEAGPRTRTAGDESQPGQNQSRPRQHFLFDGKWFFSTRRAGEGGLDPSVFLLLWTLPKSNKIHYFPQINEYSALFLLVSATLFTDIWDWDINRKLSRWRTPRTPCLLWSGRGWRPRRGRWRPPLR